MKVLELINQRRSVRTFDGVALKEDDAKKIVDFAEKAKNPYQIPVTWKMLDAKEQRLSCTVIVGTDTYISGKIRREPHAEEAFGYSFEKLVLFAQSLGVGTTWIAGTMNRSAFEQAMEVSPDEIMPCVSPLGYSAAKMSVRETMMRKGVKADSRLDFGELFFDGSFDKPLTPESAGVLKTPLDAVRLAPSAVNKQPWRVLVKDDRAHFYKKSSKGYANEEIDIQKVDIGIALCHFELAAEECGIDVKFDIKDPLLTAPEDTQYIATYVFK